MGFGLWALSLFLALVHSLDQLLYNLLYVSISAGHHSLESVIDSHFWALPDDGYSALLFSCDVLIVTVRVRPVASLAD